MIIKYKQRVIFQEILNWHKIIQSQANSIYQVVCGQSILQRESVEMCWSNDTADQFLLSKSLNTVSTIISVSTSEHCKMLSSESTEPESVSNIETRSDLTNIAGGTFVAGYNQLCLQVMLSVEECFLTEKLIFWCDTIFAEVTCFTLWRWIFQSKLVFSAARIYFNENMKSE